MSGLLALCGLARPIARMFGVLVKVKNPNAPAVKREAEEDWFIDEIRDCYKQAEACARQAAEQTDDSLRKDFLALQAAWLKLAKLRERDLSDQIRQRAYEIWIASGRDGEAEQHWLAAFFWSYRLSALLPTSATIQTTRMVIVAANTYSLAVIAPSPLE